MEEKQPQQGTVPQGLPQQQIPEVTNSNKKPLIIAGFIVVLLFIIVLTAVLLVMNNKQKVNQALPTPTVAVVESTPTPIVNSTPAAGIKLTLKKGVTTPIPNSLVTVTFTGREVPGPNCNDCFKSTNISVAVGKKKPTDLSFVCGGIAGVCVRKVETEDYAFNLSEDLEDNQIKVTVVKK